MGHVCYYNDSDATFRLLMSGDINPNPGPVFASTAGKINCLVMNASTINWKSVRNVHRFQDLVYAENSDVICVNETWLNHKISAHLEYCIPALQYLGEIGLIELVMEFLSQSKQSPSKLSKNFNLNRKPSCKHLEIIFAKITTLTSQRILFYFNYGTLVGY